MDLKDSTRLVVTVVFGLCRVSFIHMVVDRGKWLLRFDLKGFLRADTNKCICLAMALAGL